MPKEGKNHILTGSSLINKHFTNESCLQQKEEGEAKNRNHCKTKFWLMQMNDFYSQPCHLPFINTVVRSMDLDFTSTKQNFQTTVKLS